MKELHIVTYYGLLALSAMGLIQAAYIVFFGPRIGEESERSPFDRPKAPNGFRWVLMTEDEARMRDLNAARKQP